MSAIGSAYKKQKDEHNSAQTNKDIKQDPENIQFAHSILTVSMSSLYIGIKSFLQLINLVTSSLTEVSEHEGIFSNRKIVRVMSPKLTPKLST